MVTSGYVLPDIKNIYCPSYQSRSVLVHSAPTKSPLVACSSPLQKKRLVVPSLELTPLRINMKSSDIHCPVNPAQSNPSPNYPSIHPVEHDRFHLKDVAKCTIEGDVIFSLA